MKPLRYLLGILLISLIGQLATAYELPQLGKPGYDGLTQVQEAELGIQFMNSIRRYMPLVQDPLVLQYVQQLGYRLAKHSSMPANSFRFFVVKDGSINAFAAPGGYIGINSGLINAAHSEGELASVMAHEIAHVTQRHIARSIASMKKLQLVNIAAMLAAAALGGSSPQAAQGLAAAGVAGSHQSLLTHTREHEQEADRVGMKILAKSGYSPTDMTTFFNRLLEQARLNQSSQMPEFLSTHPATKNRIAESENLGRTYHVTRPRKNNPTFYFMQARTLVDSTTAITKLTRQLKAKAKQSNKLATRYAYALALAKTNQLTTALSLLQQLQKQAPNNLFITLSKARLLAATGHIKQSVQVFTKLHNDNTHNLAVTLYYAQQLLLAKQANKAAQLLKHTAGDTSGNELYLSLLARAQGKAGNLGEAYLARAQLYLLLHNNQAALTQLKQGLKFTRDRYTKARLVHEIKRLQQEIAFNKRLR